MFVNSRFGELIKEKSIEDCGIKKDIFLILDFTSGHVWISYVPTSFILRHGWELKKENRELEDEQPFGDNPILLRLMLYLCLDNYIFLVF